MPVFNVTNLTNDANEPVKEVQKSNVKVYFCKDFTGEFSSKTGIYSKFAYIGKIDELTGMPENPTIRIVCGEECIDKCINQPKNK